MDATTQPEVSNESEPKTVESSPATDEALAEKDKPTDSNVPEMSMEIVNGDDLSCDTDGKKEETESASGLEENASESPTPNTDSPSNDVMSWTKTTWESVCNNLTTNRTVAYIGLSAATAAVAAIGIYRFSQS